MRKVGYLRVSTTQQDLDLQLREIQKECPEAEIFSEKTGGASQKPVLGSLIDVLQKDDILYLYKFDRLSRRLLESLKLIGRLTEKGVRVISITQRIDTGTKDGRLMFAVLQGFAEHELETIRERTQHRLNQIKEDYERLNKLDGGNRQLGRPRKTTDTDALKNYVLGIIDESNWDWKVVSNRVKETFEVEYSPAYLRNKFYGWTDKRKPRKYLRA